MILSSLSQSSIDSTYSNSVSAISSLVSWIVSQSVVDYPADQPYTDACKAFNNMKADCMQWYNCIYPTCIQVLDYINSVNTQITGNINTLIALSDQILAQPDNQQLHDALIATIEQIKVPISNIQTQSINLKNSLSQFSQCLNTDFTNTLNSYNSLIIEINCEQQVLSNLYGKLHGLESSTCPNSNDINACKSQIASVQNLITMLNQLSSVLEQALTLASPANQALSYLLNFWLQMAKNTTGVLSAFNTVESDPSIIIKYDLQFALKAWEDLVNFANQAIIQTNQTLAKI